jgi:type I restriction-modification system DNA methylase subunit
MLKKYLKDIYDAAGRGDATEVSFYSSLESLLNNYAESTGKKKIQITTLPKQTEAGNPDFRVWDGKLHVVGYVEAKAPTVEDLSKVENSEQLKRYRKTFPNLILTNFFEFRRYCNGELADKVRISRPYVLNKLKHIPPLENEEGFLKLLEQFFLFSLPKVNTAKDLATELAKRTSFLKDEVITQELAEEEKNAKGYVHGFYEAFKKYLVHDLSQEDFADLYAQTVTYGLFAARTRSKDGFNRKLAYDYIPKTIGILKDVFRFISSVDLPKQMEWVIDDISEVLAQADVNNILHKYFREGRGKDPIVHFYETFLAEYDPRLREQRGVYYTPEPVVSYIVRSLNIILKEKFEKPNGFASEGVTVLDPAGGTLTFLAEAAKIAVEEFPYGKAAVKKFIKENILKNFYSFELMMAPYAIGHIKISFLLEELGYKLQDDDRFKLYLTNTLEFKEFASGDLPGTQSLSEESKLAGDVKREKPILAILGNPPYSGHSTNKGPWITGEIKEYFQVDGKPLKEKNPKWLNDDYVKFIRFSQWKIDQAGEGVLGFITNHSYLDNPTFRGMRQSLMKSFNEIYILDLHGNSLKKEKCPDGSKDVNVFDIQQGVAIALFIKRKDAKGCVVRHADLFGLRDKKYEWLLGNDKNSTKWKKLDPKGEFYLFIPRDEKLSAKYEQYIKVTDVFPVNSVGIVTSRDKFVIDMDKQSLKRRIRQFCDNKMPDDLVAQTYGLNDKSNWKIKIARKAVSEDANRDKEYAEILYRPFDTQWIFYHDALIERSRKDVMRHMMQDNLGLITSRMTKGETFKHAQVTQNIVEVICMSPRTSNNGFLFPLYLYTPGREEGGQKEKGPRFTFGSPMTLFEEQAGYEAKRPNISPKVFDALKAAYGKKPTPEDIFFYIYAVLYAPTYREKYAEFLRIDFPRIPFTKDKNLFKELGKLGKELVDLHLMKSKDLNRPIVRFEGEGGDKVDKIKYDADNARVYINETQYFEGVTPELYEYQIGGYQVANKWLKDRKGRPLSLDDIMHYCKVITALSKTIEIQKEIDELYPNVEKEIIEFNE